MRAITLGTLGAVALFGAAALVAGSVTASAQTAEIASANRSTGPTFPNPSPAVPGVNNVATVPGHGAPATLPMAGDHDPDAGPEIAASPEPTKPTAAAER